jgi:tetratricopeptide (TPR) repeat protein
LEEEPWRAVAHDFAGMLLNYNYPPAQGWFDEGLTEYFSSIRVDNRQVEIGGDPEASPGLTGDLPGNQRETGPQKSLSNLLGAQVWLSLPDLFAMKHDTTARDEGTYLTLYYAESWIVIHYLIHEKKLPETGAYFGLVLNQHVPVEEAIQKAYGMTSTQLEQAVKDYFRSQTALFATGDPTHSGSTTPDPTYRFPAPIGPDDSSITSKPIPDADAHALYAGVAIRIPERRETGLKGLQALATAPTASDIKSEAKYNKQEKKNDPDSNPDQLPSNALGNALAHRILAWDHIQHGEFDEAFTELGDAAALNRNDMWIRYYVSVLKYRVAQARHTDMQGLPNMMLDLRAVLEWYPELAEAYDLLALARNEGGGPAAAMQSERAAMNLSPRNERYVYHLAQIYIAGKKWEAAQALLERLKSSDNLELAALAREQLDQAATQRKYGISLNAANGAAPKLAPQKSPFDVLEEDAAKRAAAGQSDQSGAPVDKRPTKFLKGRLLAVDCSETPAAVLTVSGDGVALKLRSADYKSLLLIGADDFSCTWKNRQVTVNYKPGGQADGDIVSLEVR